MPIYEYSCKSCAHVFEALVRETRNPACPNCGGENLQRLMSMPSVKSDTTQDLAMRAAKKRDAKQGAEREHAQREYEKNHD